MQRMRSGTESKQQHEAHFSKCSALCSSTTVDTVSFHDIPRSTPVTRRWWRGPHTAGMASASLWWGSRGTAQRRPQPTAARDLLRHRGKKENRARTAAQSWALARSPQTTRSAPDPRARTGSVPVVGGGEGYGRRSRMSGERQAGLRVMRVRATPEGRWAG